MHLIYNALKWDVYYKWEVLLAFEYNKFNGIIINSEQIPEDVDVFSPQLMWFKKLRTSIVFSFIISIVVNIGMWFERFVIIVTSLHRDYLPSSWTMFSPTFVDIGIFIGTIGFFFVLFLLYARTFPVIAQAEVKTILKSSGEGFLFRYRWWKCMRRAICIVFAQVPCEACWKN